MIGYRAGGLPEVIVEGETGILCPEGQDVCLGSLGAELLEDRRRYEAMRRAARHNAERFATDPIVDQYEKALCCLIHADAVCAVDSIADCVHS